MQQPVIPSQITAYTMQQFWGFFYQCHAAQEQQRIQHTMCWSAQHTVHTAQSGRDQYVHISQAAATVDGGEDVSRAMLQLFVPSHLQELAAFLRKAYRLRFPGSEWVP
jgi:hypothetical protein